jgi:hypothetical protein
VSSEKHRAWTTSAACRANLDHHRMKGAMKSARLRMMDPVPGVDPAVVRLGAIMRQNAGLNREYIRRSGVGEAQVRQWLRRGTAPRIHMIRAALQAYGYDLAIVRIAAAPADDGG